MQELLKEKADGFSDEAINALFGPEDVNKSEDAQRGALDFWDVFPNPAGGKLVVEIMTPHFGKYYQGSDTPHDSGQPIPVSFLAVPAKSDFDFHVVCHPSRLPAYLQNQWRSLLDQAFVHAFEWVGFGAKTTVGYGAMETEAMLQQNPDEAKERKKQQDSQRQEQSAQAWAGARVKFNRDNKSLRVEKDGQTAVALQPKGEELLGTLPPELRSKIMGNQFVKVTAFVAEGVLVRVSA
jgi:CRISPR-associated protein Cmr6